MSDLLDLPTRSHATASSQERGKAYFAGRDYGEFTQDLAMTLDCIVNWIVLLAVCIWYTFASLSDTRIVMSFPCGGQACTAQILAEFGGLLERFPTAYTLAMEARCGPITKQQPGRSHLGMLRWACNQRL